MGGGWGVGKPFPKIRKPATPHQQTIRHIFGPAPIIWSPGASRRLGTIPQVGCCGVGAYAMGGHTAQLVLAATLGCELLKGAMGGTLWEYLIFNPTHHGPASSLVHIMLALPVGGHQSAPGAGLEPFMAAMVPANPLPNKIKFLESWPRTSGGMLQMWDSPLGCRFAINVCFWL